jgi:hypothetical protein
MPYDNNLSVFERPIIDMLGRGIAADDVVVVVQSDVPHRDGMIRTVLRQGRSETEAVASGDSSRARALQAYLQWARSRFDAERWGIVVLGHGGRVDQFSPASPTASGGATLRWMTIGAAAQAIARVWAEPVELLFLQNCCKGTLEAQYAFGGCARFTLSSQLPIGAPNFYYEGALQRLSQADLDGLGLANAIMGAERDDMYTGLAVARNDVLGDLATALNRLIESIVDAAPEAVRVDDLPTYDYASERLVDVRAFFESAVRASGAETGALVRFGEVYSGRLIERFRTTRPEPHGLSGLSLVIPRTRQQLRRYRGLDFYRAVRMANLLERSALLD